MRFLLLLTLLTLIPAPVFAAPVATAAEELHAYGFVPLQGKRVGVVTNATAMVDGRHLVDLLKDNDVKVVALFGPEHGVRGTAEDGEKVSGGIDPSTGAIIYSLYGETRKPTPEMLRGLDVLLFDMQDVGVRFYTYISTMGLAMQSAAEAGIPFVVLDRPNPLGGDYVSGFVLSPPRRSFVGMFQIPVAHGMTVGELALMIKGERLLPGLEKLDLRVVKMEGWRREMRWPETGLPWVATSPNIPTFEAALLYPGMCFFEATTASVGRGTAEPFRLVGEPGLDAPALAARLNGEGLPGVTFEPTSFSPAAIRGAASHPKYLSQTIPGVRVRITDAGKVLPVETGVYLLSAVVSTLGEGKGRESFFRKEGLAELAGTKRLLEMLGKVPPEEIIRSWQAEVLQFREVREKYLLYD